MLGLPLGKASQSLDCEDIGASMTTELLENTLFAHVSGCVVPVVAESISLKSIEDVIPRPTRRRDL